MSTVYQLVQEALLDIGIAPPTTIESTTDSTQKQLRAIVEAEARFLRNKTKIPLQKKSYSFDTDDGNSAFLPEDFYSMIGQSGIDTTTDEKLLGPYSDPVTGSILYEYQLTGPPHGFRIFGPNEFSSSSSSTRGQFHIIPDPPTGLTMGFEYYSRNLFTPPYWTGSQVVTTADYRTANGKIYKVTVNGTTHASTPPSHTTGTDTNGTATFIVITAPYERIIVDEDLPVFDDDIMYEGIKYRYQLSKGLAFPQDPVTGRSLEYNSLLERTESRWYGARRGRFDRGGSRARYQIPYRGHI